MGSAKHQVTKLAQDRSRRLGANHRARKRREEGRGEGEKEGERRKRGGGLFFKKKFDLNMDMTAQHSVTTKRVGLFCFAIKHSTPCAQLTQSNHGKIGSLVTDVSQLPMRPIKPRQSVQDEHV